MKKTFIVLVSLLAGFSGVIKAQTGTPSASIHWITIQDAEKQAKKHPKKILVDTYTDWCGWCKRLDATTWQDPKVIDYVNKNYYAVKFNAETHDSINFNGTVYRFNGSMRANELAYKLLEGQLAYPTIIVLDDKLASLSVIPGYQPADGMNNILHYFGDDIYKTIDWTSYNSDPNKYIKN